MKEWLKFPVVQFVVGAVAIGSALIAACAVLMGVWNLFILIGTFSYYNLPWARLSPAPAAIDVFGMGAVSTLLLAVIVYAVILFVKAARSLGALLLRAK
jgi:hypothetical protein